ncbi:MAG: DUF4193 family protein [Actinomycetota bacterium]
MPPKQKREPEPDDLEEGDEALEDDEEDEADDEALPQAHDEEAEEEASLEELLAQRASKRAQEDGEDETDIMALASERELPTTGPLPTKVIPMDRREFVCKRCHLVKARSQLADAERGLCRDCV